MKLWQKVRPPAAAALALFFALAAPAPSWAAGAFAIGKCGAYGEAYDYPAEQAARAAALEQCKGGATR